jgi:glycosyltransferase involved in cell wall biosynthesis
VKKIQIMLDQFCGNHLQDAVISVSRDLAEKLRSRFPDDKIHTIENGIDVERLRESSAAPDIKATHPDAIHIGMVGRLEPVKRVDIFLNAAQQLLMHTDQPIHFHIVGDGKLAAELVALAQHLGLTQSVHFHGHRTDPAQVIAALDMVVICSDHEGTPMTALETLALGKPLVAHSVGGLVEILADYPELLVTDHSPAGYSKKMFQIIHTKPQVQLRDVYTSETNAAATLALYQKFMKP